MTPKGKLGRGTSLRDKGSLLLYANHLKGTAKWDHNELKITKNGSVVEEAESTVQIVCTDD